MLCCGMRATHRLRARQEILPMTVAQPPAAVGSGPAVPTLKILRGGQWEASGSSRAGDVFNPSTGKVIARVPLCSAAEANAVVEAAAEAGAAWAAVPAVQRARLMFQFRELLN